MILEAKDLELVYADGQENHVVLDKINLQFDSGEKVIIAGPSGTGKSSLIYLLSTLRKPTSGAVIYKGKDITSLLINFLM